MGVTLCIAVEKLVNAAKVILLDHKTRRHLRKNDPQAFRQLWQAVEEIEPDIRAKIDAADDAVVDLLKSASENCPKCRDKRNTMVDPECPFHGDQGLNV